MVVVHPVAEYFADSSEESRCQMFHVCVGSSPSAFYSFLCPNGTLFNELYFTCDWWFNVDCHQDRTSVSDSITTSQSDSPAVRIDTIYSAIKAANEKYESQNYGGSRSVRHTLSSELRRRTNHRKQNKDIASERRHKPRYKQKHIFFLWYFSVPSQSLSIQINAPDKKYFFIPNHQHYHYCISIEFIRCNEW